MHPYVDGAGGGGGGRGAYWEGISSIEDIPS